ncbi:SCO family protein [Xylophilus sp.]|uniref:SCO family protein n=1 Tax=Xylophilus sp. TaxID=2653893 RepID=UPI0013B60344|nr:SCO family protein [Xylophilus sp.]KAF1045524.1 MAG: SCO1 protein [Xylophilus sp.]
MAFSTSDSPRPRAPGCIPPPRRGLLRLAGAGALAALAGCGRREPPAFRGVDVSDVTTYARDFRLRDPDGHERTLADFRGKAVLLFFGFTQCPDVCPTALARAAEVKRLLGADGGRFQVLFMTVDPERDTPAVLKAYTAAFDPGFLGLWTDVQGTQDTAREFKVFFRKVPTGSSYTMDHSAFSYVYDPQGRLRLVMRHDQTAQEYADDVRRLLQPA